MKKLNESINTDDLPYQMLYSKEYFVSNGPAVVEECGYHGSVLVESDKGLFGLLFKDKEGSDAGVGLKCFVFEYP